MTNFYKVIILLFVAFFAGAASGCQSPTPPPLPEEPSQAETQIEAWVPIGTSSADAIKIMEQHGFKCSIKSDLHVADYISEVDHISAELDWPGFPCERTWQATLNLTDNKIHSIHVIFHSTCL